MAETKYFNIPAGFIVLSREDYDDIVEQRITNRLDRIDDFKEIEAESLRWQTMYIEQTAKVGSLKQELDEAKAREKELSYKLFQANETNIALRSEIHLLNDELCRTDEIREVDH